MIQRMKPPMQRSIHTLLLAIGVTLTITPAALSQASAEDALAILDQCLDSGRTIRSAQAMLTQKTFLINPDMNETASATYTLKVAEPNRLALVRTSGSIGTEIVCDGTSMFECAPALMAYARLAPPSVFQSLFDHASMHARQFYDGSVLHALGPMFNLQLRDQLTNALKQSDTYIALAQDSTIDGVKFHHVRMRLPVAEGTGNSSMALMTPPDARVTVDVHISKVEPYTIRRVEADLAHIIRLLDVNAPLDDLRYGWQIDAAKWTLNEELSANDFTFTPPDGASEVASLLDAATGNSNAPAEPADPNKTLTGKPCPTVSFALRDGTVATVTSQKKDHAIVLVFWTSWFDPSIAQVAEATSVLAKLGDDRIKLYAVNYQEDAELAKKVASARFSDSVAVGFDPYADVAERFLLHSLPWTVIIDSDGTVHSILIGKEADSTKQLKTALTTMIDAWNAEQADDDSTDSDG